MELKIESYTKPYINKTDHHLYIAPSPKLQNIVAHYTITFQNHELEIPEHSALFLNSLINYQLKYGGQQQKLLLLIMI